MSTEVNKNYSSSANLRVGDIDSYPERKVGEFIGTVVANDFVNDEYKTSLLMFIGMR